MVVGGSWGVTLALVYAQRHPERVLGMVLAAVTSGRWRETQWITRDMGRVFPFLADNEVLGNMARIAHIPATLIHGRHDVSGPLDTAWELHKAWPASRLVVVDDAGHFGGSMGEQFTAAIDAMADQLRPA